MGSAVKPAPVVALEQRLPWLGGQLGIASRAAELEGREVAVADRRGLLVDPGMDVSIVVLREDVSRSSPPDGHSGSVSERFHRQPQEPTVQICNAVEREGVSQLDQAYGQVASLRSTQHRHAGYARCVIAVAQCLPTQGGNLARLEHGLAKAVQVRGNDAFGQ